MSRPYIYMQTEKESAADTEKIKNLEEDVVQNLFEYLEDYQPERWGDSKSSLMGPVGKLLSSVSSGRFENKDAIVGYVVNIHSNASTKSLSQVACNHLKRAIDSLQQLKELVTERMWLRILREIDYAVFLKQYERVSTFGTPRKEVKK